MKADGSNLVFVLYGLTSPTAQWAVLCLTYCDINQTYFAWLFFASTHVYDTAAVRIRFYIYASNIK